MSDAPFDQLSRRERQIMDVIYRRGRATVADAVDALADAPAYNTVRTLMNVLVEKGHLRHRKEGLRYVYRPTRARSAAAKAALKRAVTTFFEGSAEQAVAALLDMSAGDLSDDELKRLAELIDRARKEGK